MINSLLKPEPIQIIITYQTAAGTHIKTNLSGELSRRAQPDRKQQFEYFNFIQVRCPLSIFFSNCTSIPSLKELSFCIQNVFMLQSVRTQLFGSGEAKKSSMQDFESGTC